MSMQQVEAQSGQGLVARILWQNRLFLAFITAHFAMTWALCTALGVPFSSGTLPTLLTLLKTLIPVFLIFLMFWRFGWMVLYQRPQRPTAWFLEDMRGFVFDAERILGGVIGMAGVALFAGSFTMVKDLIPLINPFAWDALFIALDRAIHGGIDPYLWLMPVLGTPWATTAINAAYHFWFFLLYFVVFMASFDRDNPVRRNTLLLSFVLTWAIGGNLLATVFSSAGPVYAQVLGISDTFAPLIATLKTFAQTSPVWALDVHDMLIDGYLNNGPVRGISAMPSMHVASAVLLALYGFAYRRWAGWMLVIFAVLIQLGSVHLAWHYAIDGYLGAIVALACWWGAGKLARHHG